MVSSEYNILCPLDEKANELQTYKFTIFAASSYNLPKLAAHIQ